MAGDPDAHGVGVLRAHRGIDQALPGGIHVGLGPVGRGRPAVDLGLGGLHREVGPLDDADLDRGAALLPTGAGPREQLLEHGVALGQVGLQHDARLDVAELLLGQDRREHVDRQREVAVLLHVEVHERVRGGGPGSPVEPAQAHGHALHGPLVVEGAQLRGDRRDLHRDVGDLGAREHLDDTVEAVGGLVLPEHGLTQDVDVESGALGRALLEVLAQSGLLRGEDDPGGGVADLPVDELHRGIRGQRRQPTDRPKADVVAHSEGLAVGPRRGGAQRGGGAAGIGDPHHLVGEGHGHRQAGGVLEQPGQPSAVGLLPMGALALGISHPAGCAGHGAIDHGIGVGEGGRQFSWGDVHGSNRGPAAGRTQCRGPWLGQLSDRGTVRTPRRGAPDGPTGPRRRPRRSSLPGRRWPRASAAARAPSAASGGSPRAVRSARSPCR